MPSTYTLEDIQALESEIVDLRDRLEDACAEGHRHELRVRELEEELLRKPSPAIPDDSMLMKKDEVTWLYEQHGKLNDALVALEEYVAYKVSLDMHTNGGSE